MLKKNLAIRHCFLSRVFLFVLFAVIHSTYAYGSGEVNDILTIDERFWLKNHHASIILAIETTYAPFVFLDTKGQPAGLAQDYISLIQSKLGFQFEQRRFATLDDILEKVRSCDVQIVNAVTRTPARSKYISFTDPFISVPNVIIVRNNHSGQIKEENLSGLKVSLVKSYAVTEYLTNKTLNFVPDLVPDDLTALLHVSFGVSDATVIDLATASYLIEQKGITNLRVAGETAFNIQLAMGTTKAEPMLNKILQKGLAAITELDRRKINKRWIDVSGGRFYYDSRFWIVTGGLVFIALALIATVLVWNLTLQRQVDARTKALASEKEALRESEERYQSILNASPDNITITDIAGKILMVSPAGLSMFGYEREEEVAGNLVTDHLAPEDRDRALSNLALKSQKLLSGSDEYRGLRKDGSFFDVEVKSDFIKDNEGHPQKLVIIVRDISERKKTDDLLRQSQNQLSEALIMARAGHWEYDVSRDTFTFNDNFYRIFRTTAKEIGGYQMSSAEYAHRFSHPEDMSLVAEETRLAIETTNPEYSRLIEHRILFSDGEVGHIAVRFFVVKDEAGCTIQIYGVNQDITERKRMEESLRKSETKFRTIANYIHDWEYWSAPDGSLIFVSPSCEEVTGYTAEEFVQDPGLLRRIIHSNDLNDFFLHHKNLTSQPNPESCGLDEFRILTKNGEERWIAHSCRAVCDDQGNCLGRRISNQDITVRKKTEQEKEKIQEQLMQAQKMEAIGTLAGGIAHDFNNILGAILGYTEMAYEDSLQGSVNPSDLNQVIKAGHRAKDLVKQILAFSRRSDSQKIPLQPAALVKESIKLLRSSIPTTIDIQQDIDSETDLILADPTQVHQIIMNLCTNAYHAMENIGGTLSISLENKVLTQQNLVGIPNIQPGQFVQLSVKDTGSGIAPVIQERIFDPYFTTKETGKGTGMGLAIVHGIVKSSGGFITCRSEIGEGTVFEITLPAFLEQITPETKEDNVIPVGTERILLIDDEEILANMGQTMLERLGYSVTVKMSSIDALTIFENKPDAFDLVITDQTMPGMTGVDLAARLLRIRPELPIILCTGYSSQISKEKVESHGIKGFAMKPLAKKDIAVLIRKVLDCK